jgi:RHS repeat-associated protein
VTWYLLDYQHSVVGMTDASGTLLGTVTYDAFGNVLTNTLGANADEYGFTGRIYDSYVGLQNNRNRWYDAALGVWTTQDPLGFAAGDPDLYRYVGNSSTGWADPIGLYKFNIEVRPSGSGSDVVELWHHINWGRNKFIGYYNQKTGIVTRGIWRVSIEKVQAEANAIWGSAGHEQWDAWFEENAISQPDIVTKMMDSKVPLRQGGNGNNASIGSAMVATTYPTLDKRWNESLREIRILATISVTISASTPGFAQVSEWAALFSTGAFRNGPEAYISLQRAVGAMKGAKQCEKVAVISQGAAAIEKTFGRGAWAASAPQTDINGTIWFYGSNARFADAKVIAITAEGKVFTGVAGDMVKPPPDLDLSKVLLDFSKAKPLE